MSDALDGKLSRTPLPQPVRRAIVNNLWKRNYTEQEYAVVDSALVPYFRYFEDQCRHSQTSARTHKDILQIVEYMENKSETLTTLKQRLGELNVNPAAHDYDKQLEASICLAVRLWLMVYVGNTGHSLVPGHTQVNWREETICELVSKNFSPEHELNAA